MLLFGTQNPNSDHKPPFDMIVFPVQTYAVHLVLNYQTVEWSTVLTVGSCNKLIQLTQIIIISLHNYSLHIE